MALPVHFLIVSDTFFFPTLFGHWAGGWGVMAGELKVVGPFYIFWRNVDVLDPWLILITWVEDKDEDDEDDEDDEEGEQEEEGGGV